jgi:hypothetical protein
MQALEEGKRPHEALQLQVNALTGALREDQATRESLSRQIADDGPPERTRVHDRLV